MLITTSWWGPEKYPHKVKKVFRKKASPTHQPQWDLHFVFAIVFDTK